MIKLGSSPLDSECPYCGAWPGEPCYLRRRYWPKGGWGGDGEYKTYFHAARKKNVIRGEP